MFMNREDREARKQREEQLQQLQEQQGSLQAKLERRQMALNQTIEAYKQQVAEKWEYLQVSDKDISTWGNLDRLGYLGWELVGIATFEEGGQFRTIFTTYVFRRPIPRLPEEILAPFADIKQVETQIEDLQRGIRNMKQ